MFKKFFALASVTALTGLVSTVAASGCSSSTDPGAAAEASAALPEASVKKPVEAGPEDVPDTGAPTCPTTEAIDATTNPWKSPTAPQPGACAEKDITDLVAFVDANAMATYAQIKGAVTNGTCASCLFAKDGATWAPFVEKSDGTFDRLNFGGCVALETGKDACGKGYSQLDDCTQLACTDCADQTTFNTCVNKALKGACKTAQAAYTAACGGSDGETPCQALTKTYTFEAAARAQCVGLAADGGDAGDGGDGG